MLDAAAKASLGDPIFQLIYLNRLCPLIAELFKEYSKLYDTLTLKSFRSSFSSSRYITLCTGSRMLGVTTAEETLIEN